MVDKDSNPDAPLPRPVSREVGAEAFNIISKAWLERLLPPERVKIPPLSHYTTTEGLLGICRSNALWATCAQYSNDVSEVVYAKSIADKICEEFLEAEGSGASTQIKSLMGATLTYRKEDAYLISFCESSDLLSQWRGYGKAAGFEIRFESLTKPHPKLGEVLDLDSPFVSRRFLKKVLYDEAEQRETLTAIIKTTSEMLKVIQADAELAKDGELIITKFCIFEMTQWLHTVKHPSFAEEKEWRVIAFPEESKRFIGEIYKRYDLLRFRPGRHSLVPYVELTPSGSKLPIAEIVCGPGGHHELTAKAVRFLMFATDHRDVKVRNSNVPLAY